MKINPILLCFFLISLQGIAFADTVYLKNGDVIEGKILRTDENRTVIKTPSNIFQYSADDIDRIEQRTGSIAEELTDDKKELVKRLLQANGIQALIRQNIQAAVTQASPARQTQLKNIFNEEELIAAIIPIYADRFTVDDLKNLIAFFESPAGRRFVELNPMVIQEALKAIMEYFQKKGAS